MLLDELVGVIDLLQKRIRSHEAVLRGHETRTRVGLIDPLLKALGWDVSDPGVVTPEYKVRDKRADYALLGLDDKPAATVEAKRLGEPLNAHEVQMITYSNISGIDYAGVTDGNHWELYDVFRKGTLEERRMLDVSIAGESAHKSALKLLLLWRPNLASGGPTPAGEPIIVHAPQPVQASAEIEPAPEPSPESPDWVALSEYNPPRGTPCPAAIRFWDGSEQRLGNWMEVLVITVEKLYSDGLLTVDDAPIQSGVKTYMVNTEPVNPTGKRFAAHRSIDGTPLIVNVKLSAWQVRQNTKKLLQRFGQNPTDVFLQVKQ